MKQIQQERMNVDHHQAFDAMTKFLNLYYQRTKSDDVGSLLGDMKLLSDGGTADPAAWGEWLDCVELSTRRDERGLTKNTDGPKDLHDWLLCSIEVSSDKALLGFSSPDGDSHCRLVAEGVQDLVCDDLREGNIVLSLDIGIEHVTQESLNRLLYIDEDSDRSRAQTKKLRDKLTSGELQFIRVMPSYGASVIITAKSMSLE